jgi:mono/diheme cytochrome c family protein
MRVDVRSLILAASAAGFLSAANPPAASKTVTPPKQAAPQAPNAAAFTKAVAPVLGKTCTQCHNSQFASGGFDAGPFLAPASVLNQRDGWDHILAKIRSGEMPPKGIPQPEAEIDTLLKYIQGELDRIDQNTKPDPGRVVAHRLNRNEYANTIRDLLGVEFRAQKDFPTDDSGEGFDNIGEILTISPVLMEKYVAAAERIASRAVATDPLPKPIEVMYHNRDKRVRRVDASTIEATHRVEFDGEYTIRFALPGERSADAKPVQLGFWMDGKLLTTKTVETKPSGLVYFDPYSEEDIRLLLPEGDHVFRVGFINDDFVKTLAPKDLYNRKANKFLDAMTFIGPFKPAKEPASRAKVLICDPHSGPVCVDKIITNLAHHAYRRPVTRAEVASLSKFVGIAKAHGQSTEQGIQLVLQAMLVSPNFLFRIEHDPNPTDPTAVHKISDVELASRLSYFLWSSMPDDELMGLAEAGKLRGPGVLDAQVKRMLDDPRSSALADNFAGQWLEIRNLDVMKPDPQRFPEWGPELREDMRAETRMFFDYILRQNRPMTDFLNAKYTFLNDRMAKYYGIEGVKGPEFRKVDLTTDQRGGILSQASVLTVSSYPTRTTVVIRGKYILQEILGIAPPPPPDVPPPPLDEAAVGTAQSLRQQMEKHRADPVCASCHSKMDPLGFGLENYDGIGKWRTMDGKFPVDSSGSLPNGKTFSTPAEMRAVLTSQLPQFAQCVIEKLMIYALGRGIKSYDRRSIDEIGKKLAADGYPFQTAIYEIVKSTPFQQRRGESITSEKQAKPKEVAQK